MRSYVKMFEDFSGSQKIEGKTEEDLIRWILDNKRTTVVLIPVMGDGRIIGFYDRIVDSEQALIDAIIRENREEIIRKFHDEMAAAGENPEDFLVNITLEDLIQEGYRGGIASLKIKTGDVGLWWSVSDADGEEFDPTVAVEKIVPPGLSGIVERLRRLPPEDIPAAIRRMKRGISAFGM